MFNYQFRKIYKYMSIILNKVLPRNFYMQIFYATSYLVNSFTVKRYAKKYNLRKLSELPINEYKTSDTLFILGSGKSVESFTKEQWDHIKEKDSLGFNFWLIHDFVPTFYVYEESLDTNRNNYFYNILNKKEKIYQRIPFIVKDIEYKGITYKNIPAVIKSNIFLSTEMVIFGKKNDFDEYVKKGYRFIKKINQRKRSVLLKKSGSLSYLLFLAESFGYKNIVLCGVDLVNSDYFYYHPKYSSYSIPDNNMNIDDRHPTDVTTNDNIPISDVILTINEQVLKQTEINLYVASKDSALYPNLKCYFD